MAHPEPASNSPQDKSLFTWKNFRSGIPLKKIFEQACNFSLPSCVSLLNNADGILILHHYCMTEREYNECVRSYADNVYRFILKNIRHEEDARDVVQSAFEKLWVNREKVDTERSKSYLFTVAYHKMIDMIRKNKQVTLKDDFSFSTGTTREPQTHLRKILNTALYTLSETQRSLVLLKDYEGYSYDEIAVITSLSLSQVKVYLHRARIQLKKFLVKPENVL